MATETATTVARTTMNFSSGARMRLRAREKDVFNYYDDMGKGRGNCTWGAGILAHHGPCTKDELKKPVSAAAISAEFSTRVAAAERTVRASVTKQNINQEQYDALVSFTYNMGGKGAAKVLELVDEGDLRGAATKISAMIHVRVRTKHGTQMVVAGGLISRRREESAPFRK